MKLTDKNVQETIFTMFYYHLVKKNSLFATRFDYQMEKNKNYRSCNCLYSECQINIIFRLHKTESEKNVQDVVIHFT